MQAVLVLLSMFVFFHRLLRFSFTSDHRQAGRYCQRLLRFRRQQRDYHYTLMGCVRRVDLGRVVFVLSRNCLVTVRLLHRARRYFSSAPQARGALATPLFAVFLGPYCLVTRQRATQLARVPRVISVQLVQRVLRASVTNGRLGAELRCALPYNGRLGRHRQVFSSKRSSGRAITVNGRTMTFRDDINLLGCFSRFFTHEGFLTSGCFF